MEFDPPLQSGRLIRRYKRFLADVVLDDGRRVTAHCPNTGSMLGCRAPGLRVWLSPADRPGRKLRWTWELVETGTGALAGIHTGRSNALVVEAIKSGRIPELADYQQLRREVRHPSGGRTDIVLEKPGRRCWVEVKNVTAGAGAGRALFPDAVSTRAVRHLAHLRASAAAGERAVLLFCVQREDVAVVEPARAIDPAYADALAAAADAGVEVLAYGASLSPRGIRLDRRLTARTRDQVHAIHNHPAMV
ncbi:DNA/RNA nuclease SfsA [Natronospira bacteriovora]|uniref:Sugar fermentation stimulation protein homolog n=1 Tax=Natronospira bacteriovora TaxID=3069753 RepID=A0ABU0W5D9_9GAMM|nr:DNA/RNA nuclease SfsA [Natronospira sp. AB-CW4]MDQ2068265.1 DNA/RNA nuclease SfsA [Natronospira sp. AB-CW4]